MNTLMKLDQPTRLLLNKFAYLSKPLKKRIDSGLVHQLAFRRNVLVKVQDTTEIDLTRSEQQVEGAGPMDSESRREAFFHPMVAFGMAADVYLSHGA